MSVGFIYSSARTLAARPLENHARSSVGRSSFAVQLVVAESAGIVVETPPKFHRYIRHNRVLQPAALRGSAARPHGSDRPAERGQKARVMDDNSLNLLASLLPLYCAVRDEPPANARAADRRRGIAAKSGLACRRFPHHVCATRSMMASVEPVLASRVFVLIWPPQMVLSAGITSRMNSSTVRVTSASVRSPKANWATK
jgi:hypothetical protein